MKKALVMGLMLITLTSFSQNKNARASLKVSGVCLMCKERIEKASIKTKGVKLAVWNMKTHELKLIFNEFKTNLDTIRKNIVATGHDTKEMKATDKAYNNLHLCCRYRDNKVKDNHKRP